MLKVSLTKQFEKDLLKAKKQRKKIDALLSIMDKLVNNIPLPKKNQNHKLKGSYTDRWECHINADWLLIYKKTKTEIRFERLGSHSELFK